MDRVKYEEAIALLSHLQSEPETDSKILQAAQDHLQKILDLHSRSQVTPIPGPHQANKEPSGGIPGASTQAPRDTGSPFSQRGRFDK